MASNPLLVSSVDYLANHQFVLYFSDGTYATLSAQELADCVPERSRLVDTERGSRNQRFDPYPDSDTPAASPQA